MNTSMLIWYLVSIGTQYSFVEYWKDFPWPLQHPIGLTEVMHTADTYFYTDEFNTKYKMNLET